MLSHKKAIITGGNQGVGKGIALAMAQAGADVLIQYRSSKHLAEENCKMIQEMGQRAYSLQADFTQDEDLNRFINKAIEILGGVDILVNCAAAYESKPFLELTAQQFNWMNRVNAEAPLILIQHFAGYCQTEKKAGSVINVSSISGSMPSVNSTLNSCSKASLNMLTRCAALELADKKIRVNGIAPGLIDTESNLDFKRNDPQSWQKALDEIPLGRVGTPLDCGQLAVFLASDHSSWMTGAVIPIDGGMTISWRSS